MPSIVSVNLRISGDLISDGDIQVEGTVEGNVKSRMLTIGESGAVKGEIDAEQVLVSGKVVGKIKATSVTLSQTADVTGDITHEALAIESGANFEGNINRISNASGVARNGGAPLGGAKPAGGSPSLPKAGEAAAAAN